MPAIHCYVDDETMARLELCAGRLDRTVVDLAECAIAEAALDATRHETIPPREARRDD